ncbi:MAG: LysR family transcriptional regulator [Polyangiales bacterium]
MDLEELRAFLAVTEVGSFLAAEQRLGTPRATLRRRVDSLESRAGVALLHRARDGVTPTEAGAVLAARGRLMVQEANALVASIRELGREPSGVLRVLLPPGLPPQALTAVFGALRQAYPKLAVRVKLSNDPVAGLLDDFDLAAHFGARSPPGPWTSHEVLRMGEHLLAHRDYLARRGAPASLDELAGHELLTWDAPGEDPQRLPLVGGGVFPVEPALVTTDIHMIRQCVIAGMGIGFMPDGLLPDPGLDPDALVPVLPGVVGRERVLRLVVPDALAEVPKVKAVLRHVRTFTDGL